jgi:hypothetical protein
VADTTKARYDRLQGDLIDVWRSTARRWDNDFAMACMTARFVGYADAMARRGATGDEIAAATAAFVAAYTDAQAAPYDEDATDADGGPQ